MIEHETTMASTCFKCGKRCPLGQVTCAVHKVYEMGPLDEPSWCHKRVPPKCKLGPCTKCQTIHTTTTKKI